MNQLTINNKEIQFEKQGEQIFCTSLDIAEVFEKEHKNVLRDIREILDFENSEIFNELNFELVRNKEEIKKFNERNFAPVKYKDQKGEMRPAYLLTRDAFSLLAMGFTGVKAHLWKVSFINAFNQMEQMLKNQNYNENTLQLTHSRVFNLIHNTPCRNLVLDSVVRMEKENKQECINIKSYQITETFLDGKIQSKSNIEAEFISKNPYEDTNNTSIPVVRKKRK